MDIIWIGVAFVMGGLVSRIHIPPLVGYLIAGLALSVYGYEAGSLLHEIAHLGVIFLLFTVGLHIRLKNILRLEIVGVGVIHLLISTGIFVPLCLYFGYTLEAAIIISVMLGFSSTVLAAKNLEMRDELGAYYGRVAIGILIIQDLVAIGIIAYTGGGIPSPFAIALLGLPFIRPLLKWILDLIKQDEMILLMALVLAIGGATTFEWLNLSGELGALVAGMLLASDERADKLGDKLWGVKEAFLVGFFLEVGLTGFPEVQEFLFIFALLLLLPLKSILFYGLFMLFKLRSRTGFLATISLTAYSEFTLIAGVVAMSSGFIPESSVLTLGLLTAISFAFNAALAINEDRIWKKYESIFHRFERYTKHPEKQPISLGKAEFIVLGMGSAGRTAYDTLRENNKNVVGMDIDPDRIQQNLKDGKRVVYGDIQDSELWDTIELDKIKSIIIAMGNRQVKINAVKAIRNEGFNGSVYVITMRDDETKAIHEAGAYSVPIPIKQAGKMMAELSMESVEPADNIDVKLRIQ